MKRKYCGSGGGGELASFGEGVGHRSTIHDGASPPHVTASETSGRGDIVAQAFATVQIEINYINGRGREDGEISSGIGRRDRGGGRRATEKMVH